MPYRKPANQNDCIFSMTNEVHGTFDASRVSSMRSFTYEILSNETVDPYLKYFTFSMLLINLKWTIFHVLFTNAYSLICNQIVCFAFINAAILV